MGTPILNPLFNQSQVVSSYTLDIQMLVGATPQVSTFKRYQILSTQLAREKLVVFHKETIVSICLY